MSLSLSHTTHTHSLSLSLPLSPSLSLPLSLSLHTNRPLYLCESNVCAQCVCQGNGSLGSHLVVIEAGDGEREREAQRDRERERERERMEIRMRVKIFLLLSLFLSLSPSPASIAITWDPREPLPWQTHCAPILLSHRYSGWFVWRERERESRIIFLPLP